MTKLGCTFILPIEILSSETRNLSMCPAPGLTHSHFHSSSPHRRRNSRMRLNDLLPSSLDFSPTGLPLLYNCVLFTFESPGCPFCIIMSFSHLNKMTFKAKKTKSPDPSPILLRFKRAVSVLGSQSLQGTERDYRIVSRLST